MSKVTLYKCDNCGQVIQKPEDGLVIQGNVYVADPETKGGLIGNNFPVDEVGGQICHIGDFSAHVKESVYCVPCFLKVALPSHKLQAIR